MDREGGRKAWWCWWWSMTVVVVVVVVDDNVDVVAVWENLVPSSTGMGI
jgi:hypothetical protein